MNTLKKLLVSFCLVTLSFTIALAQSAYQDVVYLKNGSIIKGMIIEQIPNKSLKIQTADGSVFVCNIDDVEKITKEAYNPRKNISQSTSYNNNVYKQSGYTNITEFGVLINDGPSPSLRTVNGYLVNSHLSFGLGIGIDLYSATNISSSLISFVPIFLDIRTNLIDGPVTPIFYLDGGYSLATKTGYTGGLLINVGIGVKVFISSNVAWNLSVGYNYQTSSYTEYYYDYSNYYNNTRSQISLSANYVTLALKTGFTF